MGEVKRRKQLDPNFGNSLFAEIIVTQIGVLIVYGKRANVPFTCANLIEPGFDPTMFNYETRHKVFDWQSYFFSINQDSEKYEQMIIEVAKSYTQRDHAILVGHLKAFKAYLEKKIDKDLVTDPEAFEMRFYSSHNVTAVTKFNATEGVKRVSPK